MLINGQLNKKSRAEWLRVIKIIVPYFFCIGIFQVSAFYLLGLEYHTKLDQNLDTFQSLVIQLSSLLGTLLIVWIFIKYVDKDQFKNLGFNYLLFKDLIFGLLLGFTVLFLGFLFLFVSKQIDVYSIKFNFLEILLSFLLFVSVAFTEEVFVRGYILRNLLKCTNRWFALFLASIIFSLLHGFNPNINLLAFIDLFISGVVLGLSYIYTQNLWFSIALHLSWNFFQGTVFGFNVSGQQFYSIIKFIRPEDNILNGGAFGFEGSILSIFFQLIALFFIAKYFKKQTSRPFKSLKIIS